MRIIILGLVMCFSAIASATTLNKVVVFGDSLSDNGNLYEYMKHQLPVSPPYYEGRFSNGPVWPELLVKSYYPNALNEHLLDYAYAGAGVEEEVDDEPIFTLHSEIDSYFLAHQDGADENSLYVIWIGANNYLAVPENVEESVRKVNDGITRGLKRLVSKGAKHILVLNLPDLGRIPVAREFDSVDQLTALSTQHNALLKKNMDVLKNAYPEVQWIYFDVMAAMDEMFVNPAANGFTNITDTCYESSIDTPSARAMLSVEPVTKMSLKNSACDGFLFFDPVHPSALAHQILAERMNDLLQASDINFAG